MKKDSVSTVSNDLDETRYITHSMSIFYFPSTTCLTIFSQGNIFFKPFERMK